MVEPAGKTGVTGWQINGVRVTPDISGALFVPEHSALLVADLHLEKGSAFAAAGQLLPPYDTRKTLKKLEAAIEAFTPEKVIALGDSFHDLGAGQRIHDADAEQLARLVGSVDQWIWIEGNHDPEPPVRFGGLTHHQISLGTLILRHEPSSLQADGEICGHFHPAARLAGRSRRMRCYATDGRRMILPAFGAYTGGLSIRDPAIISVFGTCPDAWVIGEQAVYPIPARKLLA